MVSWSSGKDSAWALHQLRRQPERYDVRGIFTTVTPAFDRVSIQATPRRILQLQAERLGLPLYEIEIPYPCPNTAYEAAMRAFLDRIRALPPEQSTDTLAFGDLFLADIRAYREDRLADTGFTPIFPIWLDSPAQTAALAEEMIDSGLRAVVTALNPSRIPAEFAGRWFNRDLLADLPDGVDPLGENGEFHTCVLDGPMFDAPIAAHPGRIVSRQIALVDDNEDDGIHQRPADGEHPTYVYADIELDSERPQAGL